MKRFVFGMFFLLFLLAAVILLIIKDTPTTLTPSVSPSYWHWKDGVSPHEDTIHYLTYEEAMPDEAQD